MMHHLLNIDDPESGTSTGIALFNLGFRPFFLLAGIAAVILVPLWIFAYTEGQIRFDYYTPLYWHGHEMLFGYTVAVIAGFLLTAVRNWTDLPTPGGNALAGLVLLWLAGRIAPFAAGLLPHGIIAALDIMFLPVLAVTLAIPLLRKRQTHNLVFLLVLAALTIANVLVHLQLLGLSRDTAKTGLLLAVYLVVVLIAILGGRVIPFFTERGIAGAVTRKWKSVEYLCLGSLVGLILLDLAHAPPLALVVCAVLAAVAHGMRLFGWYQKRIWTVPLLWVLHAGYGWLVTGFILAALASAGVVNPALAIHAFTAGAIGTLTLGMMARVSLGHTGRALRVGPAMTAAFLLVNLAAVTRVFLPAINPGHYIAWLILAAVLWSTAFTVFVIHYSGVLIRPRIDGRPG
jgi:uncharacterized protein involved in response to NO